MSVTFSRLGTMGNLGNHLFQIAAVLGIAERNNMQAVFPEWKYEKYFEYPLPHGEFKGGDLVEEKHFTYTEYNLLPAKDYDFTGWLQSAKYWNRGTVIKQFAFKPELIKYVSRYITGKTVAISVRRGDFVNNPNYFQLPVSYYLNCYYTNFSKDWNVIIFSDDIAYCRRHFKSLPNIHFADGLNDIEQLCLMSLCDGHIISNSTFSWWGAYLSQSNNVYRPEKNFAGKLAKENSESDFWVPEWKVFNDYLIDLTDVTFLIPVFYDHEDRMQNLKLTLAFLLTNFKTSIIIGEQGGKMFERFAHLVHYIHFDYPYFHRTRMLNDMAKAAHATVLVNWDCDGIIAPVQIVEAVQQIREGADIVYPFDGCVCRVPRHFMSDVAATLDVYTINHVDCVQKYSSVGHAVLMNKQSFFEAGGENEHFISWSCEDSERFNRFNTLGLKIKRIEGVIYHIEHYIGINSSSKNPFFRQGEDEFLKITGQKREELKQYVNTWGWANLTT